MGAEPGLTFGDLYQYFFLKKSPCVRFSVVTSLVPRQHSSGGKATLLGISKRGDSYLRTLLIHGGRAVVRVAHKHPDKHNQWIDEIKNRRGKNIANVAVTNKNARIAWALLTKKENYCASVS